MDKHAILFLAAHPERVDRSAHYREAREIHGELERTGFRERFELVTRWAVEPLDVLRQLGAGQASIVHFSGALPRTGSGDRISAGALAQAFAAARCATRVVVLSGCYDDERASALLPHVEAVVGTVDPLDPVAARALAVGFYGALGEGRSVAEAFASLAAAIPLAGGGGAAPPQLAVRPGVDPARIRFVALPEAPQPAQGRPIDFWTERQRHARFVGREDVLAALDASLLGPAEADWTVVTGGPGVGKSALVCRWLARREAAGERVPYHLIRRQVADWDRPDVIARSLVGQLEALFPAERDPGASPERRLLELLGRIAQQLPAAGRLVIVVDGLDEARAEPGENPLPRFLPHALPPRIRILCSTRPVEPHLSWLDARDRVRRIDLDDRRWAVSNRGVVRRFWDAVRTEYEPALPAATAEAAAARADGNILHAVMLDATLRGLAPDERSAERIPHGLRSLARELWDRAVASPAARHGIGLLCAAGEALPLDTVAELAGWTDAERDRFLGEARQLLLEEARGAGAAPALRPRHAWIRELVSAQIGEARLRQHHEELARGLAGWPPPADPARAAYAVRHALAHRAAAEQWAAVRALACDLGYLEARARTADVSGVEQELRSAAQRCPDPRIARGLADLARALALESHWIRDDPACAPAVIWNRLRRLGWTARALAAHVEVPPGAAFLRVGAAAARESAALERTIEAHRDGVTALAVAAGGRMISASLDGSLGVWSLATGAALARIPAHERAATGCAATPDGRLAVSCSVDRSLAVWDLARGRRVATLAGHAGAVTACAVSPDGTRVLSASHDGTLKVWALEGGPALATLAGHRGEVMACAIAPDGRRAVSASQDRTLGIWDLDTGALRATLAGHRAVVAACAFTADGRHVVSASWDDTIALWDLATGRRCAVLEGQRDVRVCAVTPDGARVIAGSLDGTLWLWDLASRSVLAVLRGHAAQIGGCAITPDGARAVSACGDGSLKIWDLGAAPRAQRPAGHEARVTACAVTRAGARVISASRDGTLRQWALHGQRGLAAGRVIAAPDIAACAAAPDGELVITGSTTGAVELWDARGQARAATLGHHGAGVTACAVAPDGRRAVSASDDGTLRVWELGARRAAWVLEGHADWVLACAIAPDGRRALSASQDRRLRLWDLETGACEAELVGHASAVTACAVAPGGLAALSASDDGTLAVWDLPAGRLRARLRGHAGPVRGCALTADGRYAISGSLDRTVRLWDLGSGACITTHRGDAAFLCVAASPRGVLAGDDLGTLWLLEWPRFRPRARARGARGASAAGAAAAAAAPVHRT